jgi:arabinogalactan oligomer / maltooligosaccharide transport system permease protein
MQALDLKPKHGRKYKNNLSITPWTPYLFIIPAILIISIIQLYPIVHGVKISFTNMSLMNLFDPQPIGFENYIKVLRDPVVYRTFFRTIVWTVTNVVVSVAMGLWLAILLNRKLPGKSIIRVLLVLPWAVPEYINALTWKNNMFNSQYGIINIILNKLGVEPLNWLTDATLAFIACIITNIWLGFPFMMMICLGGLQSIPGELYEAADIDGATGWQKFRNITLPLLKPVLLPAAVLSSVWTFNKLTVIYLIANPADPNVHILVSKVYTAAFDNFRFGYAAAFSVIILVIIAFFASSFIRAMKGTEEVY